MIPEKWGPVFRKDHAPNKVLVVWRRIRASSSPRDCGFLPAMLPYAQLPVSGVSLPEVLSPPGCCRSPHEFV